MGYRNVCDKDSGLSSVCQSNEQPESLPKSGIVILLPHVQLCTKGTWSNYNNSTSMLSSGLKIKCNHLSIMSFHCCLDGRWHCNSKQIGFP